MPTNNYWQARSLAPMLIGRESSLPDLEATLDFSDFITELKFDGFRTIVYLDPKQGTELRSRRGHLLLPQFPELASLHKRVRSRCIVDGELLVFTNGKQDFAEVSRRSRLKNPYTIQTAAAASPASLVVFDLLHHKNSATIDKPQLERSALLRETIEENNGSLTISEYFDGPPESIYRFAESQSLEGIVLKRKDGTYRPGARTKDWIKVKILEDDDFVICGYVLSTKVNVATLTLGQYAGNKLLRMGHVVLSTNRPDFIQVKAAPTGNPPFPPTKSEAEAVWLRPNLVCTVEYTQRRQNGKMRHAVYKGLRPDKPPNEAIVPDTVIIE